MGQVEWLESNTSSAFGEITQTRRESMNEIVTSRRGFMKGAGYGLVILRLATLAGVTTVALEDAGCNVFTDIENWVPVGETAVNSILSVLTANGILVTPAISGIVTLVEAGFNALIAAIKEYQSTTPPPVGALQKIQTAFQDISDQFSAFVGQLSGVAGKVLTVVVALVKVVISTIGGFVGELPASAASVLAKVSMNSAIATPPVHRTRRGFKKDFNSTLDAGAKQGVICPSGAYMHLSLLEHF
jgi:hypothetical protein